MGEHVHIDPTTLRPEVIAALIRGGHEDAFESPAADAFVDGLLEGMADWIDHGSVTSEMRERLWAIGTDISRVVPWRFIDEVVRTTTEIVLEAAIRWGRTDVPQIGRGIIEVANAVYDAYWVYEDRAAIEQVLRFGTLADNMPIPNFMLNNERRLSLRVKRCSRPSASSTTPSPGGDCPRSLARQ